MENPIDRCDSSHNENRPFAFPSFNSVVRLVTLTMPSSRPCVLRGRRAQWRAKAVEGPERNKHGGTLGRSGTPAADSDYSMSSAATSCCGWDRETWRCG